MADADGRDHYEVLGVHRTASQDEIRDRLPAPGLDAPPRQEPGGPPRLPALQGDQRELSGPVRPAAPGHVRPLRPPGRGAWVAVQLRGAVRRGGGRHRRHRLRRDSRRLAWGFRRRPGGQGGRQTRPRGELRGGSLRVREADALRARHPLRRLPRKRVGAGLVPRDVWGVQRKGEGSIPARDPPDRRGANLLALPRHRPHREGPLRACAGGAGW